jgi:hypothetical protein
MNVESAARESNVSVHDGRDHHLPAIWAPGKQWTRFGALCVEEVDTTLLNS